MPAGLPLDAAVLLCWNAECREGSLASRSRVAHAPKSASKMCPSSATSRFAALRSLRSDNRSDLLLFSLKSLNTLGYFYRLQGCTDSVPVHRIMVVKVFQAFQNISRYGGDRIFFQPLWKAARIVTITSVLQRCAGTAETLPCKTSIPLLSGQTTTGW